MYHKLNIDINIGIIMCDNSRNTRKLQVRMVRLSRRFFLLVAWPNQNDAREPRKGTFP